MARLSRLERMMKAGPWIKQVYPALIALVALSISSCTLRSGNQSSWPTYGWSEKNPRNVGLDTGLIEEMLDDIDRSDLALDSLIVIHQGAIVVERYYFIYNESTLHETYSVTKSVISALVGIAIQQGCIESIDDPVLKYFPEGDFQNLDDQKESLTIKHLLTMSSGLAYDPDEMYAALDWAQYTLDQPLIHEPGSTWFYSNGGPQVLSSLISQACDTDTARFAEENLFQPLGIKKYQWQRSLDGQPNGSWGLELTPRDMAKFGYLYLQNGVWDGEQILPPDWVGLSTTRLYHRIPDPLEPWNLYYGFLWWIHGDGFYAAHGYKGQFIYLAPEYDLVVVITANLSEEDFVKPQQLIRNYLIPAMGESYQVD